MRGVGRQTLDGHDVLAGDLRHLRLAGAHGRAVDMHRAGAAQTGAAAVFGASQADMIADHP